MWCGDSATIPSTQAWSLRSTPGKGFVHDGAALRDGDWDPYEQARATATIDASGTIANDPHPVRRKPRMCGGSWVRSG
jgi:hypothetical protein